MSGSLPAVVPMDGYLREKKLVKERAASRACSELSAAIQLLAEYRDQNGRAKRALLALASGMANGRGQVTAEQRAEVERIAREIS